MDAKNGRTKRTSPKPFVFVLMPFQDDFSDIYKFGIKGACEDAGAYCERVDEQIFTETILERIYNQISKADIIVSDMTGRNPNVFYETGYAHALNKQVILLTQISEDIPFDLKHYPHIIYEGNIDKLRNNLKNRIMWCIQNPTNDLSKIDIDLDFYINNQILSPNASINVPLILHPGFRRGVRSSTTVDKKGNPFPLINFEIPIHVGIYNSTNNLIQRDTYSFGLVISNLPKSNITVGDEFRRYGSRNPYGFVENSLPTGEKIWLASSQEEIWPDAWRFEKLDINGQYLLKDLASVRKNNEVLTLELNANMRVFTQVGAKDIKFKIKCESKIPSAVYNKNKRKTTK
jgi:hypothetical protein